MTPQNAPPSRDELASRYIDQLPYPPYPVQEEALLAWFSSDHGVLVCAPTGTGKTLIAEAALFEALHTGTTAYYTTPLIALTEQKFREMQSAAVRWGFAPTDVGLVTGNRRENPDARVLVVVAEILLNRLLHTEMFDFSGVSAVVMDEFHSFNDPERGIVWELTLGLLPPQVRLLLLSATVGNANEFMHWMRSAHRREVDVVQSQDRKVPLVFQWVADQLLVEHIETMAEGDDAARKTPALVFCFNREECWTVAEQLKGKRVLGSDQQARLVRELEAYSWSDGAGPKLKQLLMRGVGVHHAGVLPKYRRVVEELFEKKLLSVAVCTETLSAGINLPARSVVVPTLVKGPPDKQKLIDASSAHQIFGRAGRPQYDTQGYVFVLAHDDDVKINRWREKFDQIPETTKDPGLLRMKKDLKRKMPKRRENQVYWTEPQFQKLCAAPPAKLYSRGRLPWRLLTYMLEASPEVERIRRLVGKRLMDAPRLEAGQRDLDDMLLTLWRAGYLRLEPEPPADAPKPTPPKPAARPAVLEFTFADPKPPPVVEGPPPYRPELAHPTAEMEKLGIFRGVNPLYGVFLINQLGTADRAERVQAMESVLELPRSLGHFVRVPKPDYMPPGPLATGRLDPLLLQLGLATSEQITGRSEEPDEDRHRYPEDRVFVLTLAEKLKLLFDYDFPGVHDLFVYPVWAAGEVLEFADFNKYVTSKGMQKQEGVVFRHLLRLILLIGEFSQLSPPDADPLDWRADLDALRQFFTEVCRGVDPTSTEKALEQVEGGEEGEE